MFSRPASDTSTSIARFYRVLDKDNHLDVRRLALNQREAHTIVEWTATFLGTRNATKDRMGAQVPLMMHVLATSLNRIEESHAHRAASNTAPLQAQARR
ncbi:hypothetical protein MCOR25_007065 [Pyricularia grisea]|nr:hypothetical protein MCOR25_007065 [Pyricularia grisea]